MGRILKCNNCDGQVKKCDRCNKPFKTIESDIDAPQAICNVLEHYCRLECCFNSRDNTKIANLRAEEVSVGHVGG